MLSENAKDFAETLEELRVEMLGADASFKVLRNGETGLEESATVNKSFYLKRKSSVVLGAEFIEIKVSERTAADEPNFTIDMRREMYAVEYKGTRYKAALVEAALNTFGYSVVRLTDWVE